MKMPLSDYQQTRIVSVWTQTGQKMTMTRIARILAMEGIVTTRQTIKSTITRWQKTGNVREFPISGPPKRVPESYYCCIGEAMTRNELTASALKGILTKRFAAANVQYNVRTLARLCNELGWTFTTARYCQAIQDANKQK